MSADTEEITRLRKPRFSYEENQILIQEVRANYSRLYGTQSRRVTVAERRRVWENIATKINTITSWKRTGQEVQKRWNDFKRRTKEKLARVPHSTQGAGASGGPTSEENFSAEEETIFAILGPGVVAGAGRMDHVASGGVFHHQVAFPRRFHLAEESRAELPASLKVSSSPEASANASCCTVEAALLQPKERDSPPPEPAIQIVQLPCLAHSPADPSPTETTGDSPPGSSISPPTVPLTSSHQRRRSRPRPELPPTPDPSLDFLQAQRETTEAIRDLAYTIRNSIDRLTNVVAALLPLFQHDTGILRPSPHCTLPAGMASPLSAEVLATPSANTFTTKVEASPEPEEDEDSARYMRNSTMTYEEEEEEEEVMEMMGCEDPSEPPILPPKRKKGYLGARKRRGRWKNL
ncbi:myb-related transcription factor, partner of profilin [Rhinatrema bivittatum]|uniref:myb-related transcription factor, partner of profilin n=1 Tax=Rhinatrema bivittatum TaxID=194408 RepID=UPI001128952A|nr:myb-related transcription factor, partner of profilin [Rhinatrema bivittatum]